MRALESSNVRSDVIFLSLTELIGALLPSISPTTATAFANNPGIFPGGFLPSCSAMTVLSSINDGWYSSVKL